MVARVQNAGLARITAALIALNWWLQWGTGSAAAASANVVTTTTTTEARAAATTSQQTTGSPSVTNNTMRLTATITAAGTRAITEVGAFDAAGSGSPPTGGNMDIYGDFASIGLTAGDSIAFTIDTKFT